MHTDPIADMLTRLRNAHEARKESVRVPASRLKLAILQLLSTKGFVKKVTEEKSEKFPELKVELDLAKPLHVKRVSKPGHRRYVAGDKLTPVLNGLGVAIISTSQGIMTNVEAHKKGIGGEIICEVY